MYMKSTNIICIFKEPLKFIASYLDSFISFSWFLVSPASSQIIFSFCLKQKSTKIRTTLLKKNTQTKTNFKIILWKKEKVQFPPKCITRISSSTTVNNVQISCLNKALNPYCPFS